MTDPEEPEWHPRSNRRDFVRFGGLAAGGLLGSAGLANAAGADPSAVQEQRSPGPALESPVEANLYYSDEVVGDTSNNQREGSSDLWAVDWSVDRPGGGGSRRPTGRPTISDVVVAKRIDSASVPVYERFKSGQTFSELRVEFYRAGEAGDFQNYFTLVLADAHVSGVDLATTATNRGPAHLDLVSFAPQTVTVVDVVNGAEVELAAQATTR